MTRSFRRSLVPLTLALSLAATLLGALPASAAPNGYVRMSDGVLIAINVRMPDGFQKGKRYPTIFEMSGYDGGSAQGRTLSGEYLGDKAGVPNPPLADDSRQLSKYFNKHYVTIHASVRGTGCSGGEFDLFSSRAALDGYEVIEWIARQRYSNGKVGILGHSYGGITGTMVAATRPPHLVAMNVSGLIDDLYRGIVYPGGVSNYGFPLLWAGGIRGLYDVGGGTAPGIVRTQDETCIANQAAHRRTVLNDAIVQGISDTDNDWFRARSLTTVIERINVPIHITGAYQDEQTGPRGPAHLWEMVRGVPKRLVLTNGDHGTNMHAPETYGDRRAWMDHWMRGLNRGFGRRSQDRTSVRTLLEMHRDSKGKLHSTAHLDRRTFPLEDTRWTDWYLRPGTLQRPVPGQAHHSDLPYASYFSGSNRQAWSYQAGPRSGSEFTTPEGPDELTFRSPAVRRNLAIVGPITAMLRMSSTAPDTEIFVQLIDEGPDGSHTYLQRGMLRASHRAINAGMSDFARRGGRRHMYRPFRPHVNPTEIVPGEFHDYTIEVFPVGHVFRKGHRIALKVHAPPQVDSYYAYVPRRAPSVNTIELGYSSKITLPVIPLRGVKLGKEIPCGGQEQVRCVS